MNAPHRAKRSLGQNFLTDPAIQQRIVQAIDPKPDDVIIEIGPGQGALTRHLVGTVKLLIVIELDDALAAALQSEYADREDVRVIHADVLDVDFCRIFSGVGADELRVGASECVPRFKVIGNIPYNITTPILFKLLERACRPRDIVLMVQREVAERVTSPAGNKTYGALSVGVQALADATKLFHVARGSFRPAPNVDSAVMRIVPHDPPHLSADEERDLRTLTRTAFGWRRKQLQKILRSAPAYEARNEDVAYIETGTGIRMDARPETLSPSRFVELARALRAIGLPAHNDAAGDSANWE